MYAIVICFHNVLFYVLKGEMYIKKFTKRKKRATFAAVNGIMRRYKSQFINHKS